MLKALGTEHFQNFAGGSETTLTQRPRSRTLADALLNVNQQVRPVSPMFSTVHRFSQINRVARTLLCALVFCYNSGRRKFVWQ